MQQQVEAAGFSLKSYIATMIKKHDKSAPARKALEAIAVNPAIVAACGSAALKLDRDYWLGPVRDSIVGLSTELRDEILMDLIAIDERTLEVYSVQG